MPGVRSLRVYQQSTNMQEGYVNIEVNNGIGTITFFHPQSNSLPAPFWLNLRALLQKQETTQRSQFSF